MMAMDARYVCAKVIQEVIDQGSHLDHALAHHSGKLTHTKDRALAQELCYGTLRWYHRLAFILGKLLEKPLKSRDNDIQALLCSGLYQMGYLRIPDHAAISATVETARTLGKSWACDLVNAVLRRYQREKAALDQLANDSEPAHFSHPQWLINSIRTQWPECWPDILEANNTHPPLHLRVNLLRHTRAEYVQKLDKAGIDATLDPFTNSGIQLTDSINVDEIPGFREGEVSVQDFGAQLAADLLAVSAGDTVLDACAAPAASPDIYSNARRISENWSLLKNMPTAWGGLRKIYSVWVYKLTSYRPMSARSAPGGTGNSLIEFCSMHPVRPPA